MMGTLKPKSKDTTIYYVPMEIREITTRDVTYYAMDVGLIKKYFPEIYKDIARDVRLKRKGGKE